MAGEDEVLIKIAADVAQANTAIQSIGTTFGDTMENIAQNTADTSLAMQTMIGVFEGMASVFAENNQKTEEAAPKAQSFWDMMVNGAKDSTTASVAWGNVIGESMKKLQDGIAGAITGFPKMIAGQAEAGDQLKTMASRLGTTTEAIAEMKYIGEQAGVSTEIMARSMQGLGASLTDSGSKASKAINGLGISLDSLKGKSDTDQLRMIVEHIKALPPEVDKGAKMMEVFGAKARGMTQLVEEDLGKLQTDFKELGGADNQQALGDLGDEFNDLSNNIKVAGESFNRSIAVMFLPTINSVLEKVPMLGGAVISVGGAMADLGQSMLPLMGNMIMLTGSDKGLAGLVEGFGKAKDKIADFGKDALKIAQNLKSTLIPNMIAMTQAIVAQTAALLLNPWTWVAIAVVALGVAIYKLIGGWEGLSAAMEPVIQFFKDAGVIIEALGGELLADLVGWVEELAGWFTELFASTEGGMSVLQGLIDWASEWISYLEQFPVIGEYIKATKMELEFLWMAAQKIYEWVTKFGQKVIGWFKGVAEEAHATAEGIRAENAALEHAKKLGAEMEKVKADAAKGTVAQVSAMDRLKAKTDQLNSAYKSLTDEQKKNIKEALAAGQSSKEIAESIGSTIYHNTLGVDQATKVIDMFKDKLKEAEQAAKKDPFRKLMEDAKELATSMKEATDAHAPLLAQIEAFGKKADEIATKAALRGELDKIDKSIVDMAEAWNKTQLDEKIKATTKASLELATAFDTKVREAATAAATAITAMQASITEAQLSGSEQRLFQIDKEKNAQLAAVVETGRKLDEELAERAKKENEIAETRIKNEQAQIGLGRELSEERKTAIRAEAKAVIDGEQIKVDAVKASLEDQKALIKMHAEWRVALDKWMTGIFEVDAKAAGLVTAQANAEELERQKRKLELMKDVRSGYSAWEIAEQEKHIAQMEDQFEASAARRGQATAKSAQIQLQTEKDKLAEMQAAGDKYNRVQIAAQEAIVKQAKAAAGIVTADWSGALDKLGAAFAQLAQISGGTFGGIMKSMGEVVGQVGVMKTGISSVFGKDGVMGKGAGGIGGALKTAFGEGKGKSTGVLGMIKGITGSIPLIGTAISGVMAAASAAIAIGKKMWDAFTKTPGEKMAKELERDFKTAAGKALKVSEEFGNKIAKTAADMFKGDRFAAGIYHLQDIIKEAGGLSEKNFSEMSGKLRDVFSLVQKGTFTTEQATKVLDENFTAFAKHVTDTGKIATKEFTDLLRLQGEFGTQSKEITNFVAGETAKIGKGVQTLIGSLTARGQLASDVFDEREKDFEEVAKERASFIESLGKKDKDKIGKEEQQQLDQLTAKYAEAQKEMMGARGEMTKLATESQPQFERAGRMLMASFNAATKAGVPMMDAVEQLGPGIDEITTAMEKMGTTVEESSVSWIVDFRHRMDINKGLVESTGSLNEIMLAMSNIGALNEESFKDLQDQGLSSFDQLKAAGFSENESLKMMGGFLESARDAHVKMGLPIDENTARMITQAEEAGIIKEQQLDTNKIMMEGLGAIIEAVGGKLPAAWKTAQEAASDSAKTLAEDVDDTVNATLEEQEEKLKAQQDAWDDEAKAAAKAAFDMKRSMEKVDKSLDHVQDSLDDTDWEGWAQDAVDAAEDVEGAVTGVAEGHSPGGIKEIPIRLNQANRAFKAWERVGVTSAENLQDTIDSMRGRELGITGLRSAGVVTQMDDGSYVREVAPAPTPLGNESVNLTFNITSMDPAGVELVTERKILPAMVKILRRGRNLADLKTVLDL